VAQLDRFGYFPHEREYKKNSETASIAPRAPLWAGRAPGLFFTRLLKKKYARHQKGRKCVRGRKAIAF
jgi:hypothetical protein